MGGNAQPTGVAPLLPSPSPSPSPGKGGAPGLSPPNFDLSPTSLRPLGPGPTPTPILTPFQPLPAGPPISILPFIPPPPFIPEERLKYGRSRDDFGDDGGDD